MVVHYWTNVKCLPFTIVFIIILHISSASKSSVGESSPPDPRAQYQFYDSSTLQIYDEFPPIRQLYPFVNKPYLQPFQCSACSAIHEMNDIENHHQFFHQTTDVTQSSQCFDTSNTSILADIRQQSSPWPTIVPLSLPPSKGHIEPLYLAELISSLHQQCVKFPSQDASFLKRGLIWYRNALRSQFLRDLSDVFLTSYPQSSFCPLLASPLQTDSRYHPVYDMYNLYNIIAYEFLSHIYLQQYELYFLEPQHQDSSSSPSGAKSEPSFTTTHALHVLRPFSIAVPMDDVNEPMNRNVLNSFFPFLASYLQFKHQPYFHSIINSFVRSTSTVYTLILLSSVLQCFCVLNMIKLYRSDYMSDPTEPIQTPSIASVAPADLVLSRTDTMNAQQHTHTPSVTAEIGQTPTIPTADANPDHLSAVQSGSPRDGVHGSVATTASHVDDYSDTAGDNDDDSGDGGRQPAPLGRAPSAASPPWGLDDACGGNRNMLVDRKDDSNLTLSASVPSPSTHALLGADDDDLNFPLSCDSNTHPVNPGNGQDGLMSTTTPNAALSSLTLSPPNNGRSLLSRSFQFDSCPTGDNGNWFTDLLTVPESPEYRGNDHEFDNIRPNQHHDVHHGQDGPQDDMLPAPTSHGTTPWCPSDSSRQNKTSHLDEDSMFTDADRWGGMPLHRFSGVNASFQTMPAFSRTQTNAVCHASFPSSLRLTNSLQQIPLQRGMSHDKLQCSSTNYRYSNEHGAHSSQARHILHRNGAALDFPPHEEPTSSGPGREATYRHHDHDHDPHPHTIPAQTAPWMDDFDVDKEDENNNMCCSNNDARRQYYQQHYSALSNAPGSQSHKSPQQTGLEGSGIASDPHAVANDVASVPRPFAAVPIATAAMELDLVPPLIPSMSSHPTYRARDMPALSSQHTRHRHHFNFSFDATPSLRSSLSPQPSLRDMESTNNMLYTPAISAPLSVRSTVAPSLASVSVFGYSKMAEFEKRFGCFHPKLQQLLFFFTRPTLCSSSNPQLLSLPSLILQLVFQVIIMSLTFKPGLVLSKTIAMTLTFFVLSCTMVITTLQSLITIAFESHLFNSLSGGIMGMTSGNQINGGEPTANESFSSAPSLSDMPAYNLRVSESHHLITLVQLLLAPILLLISIPNTILLLFPLFTIHHTVLSFTHIRYLTRLPETMLHCNALMTLFRHVPLIYLIYFSEVTTPSLVFLSFNNAFGVTFQSIYTVTLVCETIQIFFSYCVHTHLHQSSTIASVILHIHLIAVFYSHMFLRGAVRKCTSSVQLLYTAFARGMHNLSNTLHHTIRQNFPLALRAASDSPRHRKTSLSKKTAENQCTKHTNDPSPRCGPQHHCASIASECQMEKNGNTPSTGVDPSDPDQPSRNTPMKPCLQRSQSSASTSSSREASVACSQFDPALRVSVPCPSMASLASSTGGLSCCICYEPIRPAWVTKTACNHSYHALCLLQWSSLKNTCPLCRRPLTLIDIFSD